MGGSHAIGALFYKTLIYMIFFPLYFLISQKKEAFAILVNIAYKLSIEAQGGPRSGTTVWSVDERGCSIVQC
jgi:hypothetical protein